MVLILDLGLDLDLGMGMRFIYHPIYPIYPIHPILYIIFDLNMDMGIIVYSIWHYIWTWLYGLSYMVFDIWGMRQDGGTDSGIGIGIGIGHTGGHLIQGFWGISRDGDGM
jgi:hypothetical protein